MLAWGDGVGWPLTSEVCSVLLLNYNIKVIHLDVVWEKISKTQFFLKGGASCDHDGGDGGRGVAVRRCMAARIKCAGDFACANCVFSSAFK